MNDTYNHNILYLYTTLWQYPSHVMFHHNRVIAVPLVVGVVKSGWVQYYTGTFLVFPFFFKKLKIWWPLYTNWHWIPFVYTYIHKTPEANLFPKKVRNKLVCQIKPGHIKISICYLRFNIVVSCCDTITENIKANG